MKTGNWYLNQLFDTSFPTVNRLFVLWFEYDVYRRSYKWHFLPAVGIKDYNVMIDGKKFFDQPVKYDLETYENIWKIDTGPRDDYTTGCLLDSNYFKNYYEMIAMDLRKQQSLDADPRAIQQISNTTNTQVSRLPEAFANNSSDNIMPLKTQLNRIGKSGQSLDRLLGPLLTTRLPLMKNGPKPLTKSTLIPLGLIATAAEPDVAVHKKFLDQVWLPW